MTIGESIRALRLKRGLTQKQLGDAIGVAEQSIYRYENGISHPTFRILSKLESFFGVSFGYNPDYSSQISTVLNKKDLDSLSLPKGKKVSAYYDLIARKDNLKHWIDSLDYNTFGRVEQLLSIAGIYNEESASSTAVSDMNKNIEKAVKPLQRLMIPVVGRSAAGLPIEMIEVPEDPVYINGETRIQPGDFAVIAAGDSMIGVGISDGNKCIIRPQNCVENGQIALVAVGDSSTIKRFFMDEDGFRLVPCNPDSPVQNYPPDAPVCVLGLFISVIK